MSTLKNQVISKEASQIPEETFVFQLILLPLTPRNKAENHLLFVGTCNQFDQYCQRTDLPRESQWGVIFRDLQKRIRQRKIGSWQVHRTQRIEEGVPIQEAEPIIYAPDYFQS